MPLATLAVVLGEAMRGGYAVGEFSIASLEDVEPILEVMERDRSPVVLDFAEVFTAYTLLKRAAALVRSAAEDYSVPIVLHYGHATTLSRVEEALDAGFTSVMFDASREPFDENLRQTVAATELIHAAGVSVEAELGHVGGRETSEQAATESAMTVPDEAREYVARTNVDSLAICVGNAHGVYRGKPSLDFDLIRILRQSLPCALALHGGSGLPDDDLRRAVDAGITKVSVYTDISIAQVAAAREALAEPSRYLIFPQVIAQARVAAEAVVASRNSLYGGIGRG